MPDNEYIPAGWDGEPFEVPVYPGALDGPTAFKLFADSVAGVVQDERLLLTVDYSDSHVIGAGDIGKAVCITSATDETLTFPVMPAGSWGVVTQGGAGNIECVGSGVTIKGWPGATSIDEDASFAYWYVTTTLVRVGGSVA